MHIAHPGIGAEDASIHLAIEIEHGLVQQANIAGGSTDLRQRFDRIWKELVYPPWRFSREPLQASFSHMQNLLRISSSTMIMRQAPAGPDGA